ncbi:GNAT family protein [Streptomyces sp. G-G2]|uniref:GNAT family N-acetyltransferase n=1 Tax=Streptomyces sp. G-G2 TaxID=3046201 RepID=UPI0024BB8F13|nr:GNAT family protein [Streptomyces sp. G-G2]MDJ0379566.1 GNAT family protein [Streptomyces sp. G-G2]
MIIADGVDMREVALGDAAALAAAFVRNRAHMAPYEPTRLDEFYTERGQRERIETTLGDRDAGRTRQSVLLDTATRELIGTITLQNIVLGPLRSAGVGYWIDRARTGRGLASAALAETIRVAREETGLHRLAAGTLLDNLASQRVLAKAGFETYGVAPRYLYISGAWRDHRLFQLLLHDDPPSA